MGKQSRAKPEPVVMEEEVADGVVVVAVVPESVVGTAVVVVAPEVVVGTAVVVVALEVVVGPAVVAVEGIEVVVVAVVVEANTDGRSIPNRRRCRIPLQPGILGNIIGKYVF